MKPEIVCQDLAEGHKASYWSIELEDAEGVITRTSVQHDGDVYDALLRTVANLFMQERIWADDFVALIAEINQKQVPNEGCIKLDNVNAADNGWECQELKLSWRYTG